MTIKQFEPLAYILGGFILTKMAPAIFSPAISDQNFLFWMPMTVGFVMAAYKWISAASANKE